MKKQSWVVKMRCTVTKEVVTSECTKAEAQDDPWEHAEDEREIDQEDWEVLSVVPND